MFGINKLTTAITTLTGNVLALAGTVAEINTGVRARLRLDCNAETPALPGPAEAEGTPPIAAGRRKSRARE